MYVYLVSRWRRWTLILVLILTLLLQTANGRLLLRENYGDQTNENAAFGLNSLGDVDMGVVTTNSTQKLTTVTKSLWNSDSNPKDVNQVNSDTSVSFNSLVKVTTPMPIVQTTASSTSASIDCDIMTLNDSSSKIHTGNLNHGDDGYDGIDNSVNHVSYNAGDGNSLDSKSTNDEMTPKVGTPNMATAHMPTQSPTLPSTQSPVLPATQSALAPTPLTNLPFTQSTHAPPTNAPPTNAPPTNAPPTNAPPTNASPLRPDSFDDKTQMWSSSSGSSAYSVIAEESNSINNAATLENKPTSANSTTANRSFDQTIIVVSVGVVGAIGSLLMIVSRKVMKESRDDKDLEDSSII
ncbi:unnamed protein product [Peronospora belbahrii]|uniref:Mid2 domain-containing protein n=1 Tax=Peronospora belbahrii TaxID=622444 RepID=A0ABN8D2S2_9STRA|nr:unnamed protein product [Peronospora belbahrii]